MFPHPRLGPCHQIRRWLSPLFSLEQRLAISNGYFRTGDSPRLSWSRLGMWWSWWSDKAVAKTRNHFRARNYEHFLTCFPKCNSQVKVPQERSCDWERRGQRNSLILGDRDICSQEICTVGIQGRHMGKWTWLSSFITRSFLKVCP